MARVLILDGSQRSALAATRSLGRRLEAVVAEEVLPCLAGRSRHAAATRRYPSPAKAPEEFQDWLVSECRQGGYDMILPLTDVTAPLVLRQRKDIEGWARLPFVDLETYEAATDKGRLLELAARLGLPVPRSMPLERPTDVTARDLHLSYPLVVKPQRSKTPLGDRLLEAGPTYARTEEELARILTTHPVLSRVPVVIQEKIEGEGIGLFALYQDGRPVRLFAHRRLKEKPPSGGVSVLCESVRVDAAVEDYSLRLLDSLAWHGAAMVEFRRERGTGIPYLMEVNARFWGSLQLAIDCGIDFPFDLYRVARGERLSLAESHYAVGRRSRWLLGCLDHYYLRLKTGNLRSPNGAAPGCGGARDCVFRRDDPRPFLWELKAYLHSALGLRS